jgi:hypothetical protein
MASENTPSRTLELTESYEFSSSPTSSSAREGRVRQGRLVDGGRNRSFAEHGEGWIQKEICRNSEIHYHGAKADRRSPSTSCYRTGNVSRSGMNGRVLSHATRTNCAHVT